MDDTRNTFYISMNSNKLNASYETIFRLSCVTPDVLMFFSLLHLSFLFLRSLDTTNKKYIEFVSSQSWNWNRWNAKQNKKIISFITFKMYRGHPFQTQTNIKKKKRIKLQNVNAYILIFIYNLFTSCTSWTFALSATPIKQFWMERKMVKAFLCLLLQSIYKAIVFNRLCCSVLRCGMQYICCLRPI